MMLPAIVIALLLQAPVAVPRAAEPASISGVVVHSGTGEPLANVRVTLARTDLALGAFGQMIAGGDRPPGDVSLPAELLGVIAQRMVMQIDVGGASPQEAAEANAFSALPLGDIEELVMSAGGDVSIVSKSVPPITTDSQGRFAFNNVEPGSFRLMFSLNGFARQDYGQRSVGGTGIPIVLGGGQAKSDIVMRMSQVGAIGGRIADSAGRPIAGVPVQLMRFAYDESGQRKVQRVASAQTDDRGQYRMYFLSPGRYYLNAGNLPGQNGAPITSVLSLTGAANSNANRIPEKYTLRYYPDVADASSATPIDIPPGADISGVDMYLKVQQTFRIRGVVVDSRNGQVPPSASISLNLRNADPNEGSFVNFGDGGPNYNAADGTFELRNISSGAYTVTANLPNPNQPRIPDLSAMSPAQRTAIIESLNAASAAAPRATASVDVVNSDVEGIQLRVGTTGSITGRFRSDQDPSIAVPEFIFLRVQMKPVDAAASASSGNGIQSGNAKPDGTFRIDSLWPGEYRLNVIGLPTGFYVKEARFGDAEVLSGNLRFSSTDARTLDIVISSKTGQIEGSAANSQGKAIPGARVVLVPERNRERTELFRPVNADPSGHFTIPAVAPGDYKLVAWESIEPFAFFDSELLKQADDNGKPVRVSESSKQSVNVIAIVSGQQ